MTRYYIDTEFDGDNLLSLAMVRQDGRYIYLVQDPLPEISIPWVAENVVPKLLLPGLNAALTDKEMFGLHIADFLGLDMFPEIVSDWPDDIRHFCNSLIVAPGKMVDTARTLTFKLFRVDAWTGVPEDAQAGRHNAYYDALKLAQYFGFAKGSTP